MMKKTTAILAASATAATLLVAPTLPTAVAEETCTVTATTEEGFGFPGVAPNKSGHWLSYLSGHANGTYSFTRDGRVVSRNNKNFDSNKFFKLDQNRVVINPSGVSKFGFKGTYEATGYNGVLKQKLVDPWLEVKDDTAKLYAGWYSQKLGKDITKPTNEWFLSNDREPIATYRLSSPFANSKDINLEGVSVVYSNDFKKRFFAGYANSYKIGALNLKARVNGCQVDKDVKTPAPIPPKKETNPLSDGAIAAIVLGVIAVLAVLGGGAAVALGIVKP